MFTEEYSKVWDKTNGYSVEEAKIKKAKVDEAHGVGLPNSKWQEAEIIPDHAKVFGYKIIISTK